ncbi:hypothetical protein PsorP6_002318 [Peronosclerospora sorghi]|uniref:Uncharacterized protein n=1 Tax=Peronosclerospora sorghi TaxID=230839 RepID=A0ACC0WXH4_9STRA|nr:hypothetical protein PsorP6_002318 [Peronosclerospora sorghi]
MDLREQDIEARVLKYFIDFDKIVEDHGLGSIVGSPRMKARCRLMLKHVRTEALLFDVERSVSLTNRSAKLDYLNGMAWSWTVVVTSSISTIWRATSSVMEPLHRKLSLT